MEWRCWQHEDCFALNAYGRCTALDDIQFKGPCPFYKTKAQHEKERQEREERENRYEYL